MEKEKKELITCEDCEKEIKRDEAVFLPEYNRCICQDCRDDNYYEKYTIKTLFCQIF